MNLEDLTSLDYASPEGTTHFPKYDNLSREGSKKASITEIPDSDESMSQDQGLNSFTFSMDLYFTGDSYKDEGDAFWDALCERYTQKNPGYLGHPRWGNITVLPVSWIQSESYILGVGTSKFSVVFRKTFPVSYPESAGIGEGGVLSDVDSMQNMSMYEKIKTGAKAIANVASKIKGAITAVTDALSDVAALQEDIISEIEAIKANIDGIIDDVAGNIATIISNVQTIQRLPAQIISDTKDKINGYKDMISDLIDNFETDSVSREDKLNNAVMLEIFGGFGMACLAEAALSTNFETRTDGIEAADLLNEVYDELTEAISSLQEEDLINYTYTPDHNYLSYMQNAVKMANALLLSRAFDLKSERKKVLTANSDIITLCYEYYKDVSNETIAKFVKDNKIVNDEFFEIPAGREIVHYAA